MLRVYRRHAKSDADIRQEIDFVQLVQDKIPAAPFCANTVGEFLTTVVTGADAQPWQAVLMPRIWGFHSRFYTRELLADVARYQAIMHEVAAMHPPAENPLVRLRDTQFLAIGASVPAGDELGDLLVSLRSVEVDLPAALPSGWCHTDVDLGNILVNDHGKVAGILDFADLVHAPLVVCLGYTLLHIYLQDAELAREYLAHYQRHRQLTTVELAMLPQVMLFRLRVIGLLDYAKGKLTHANVARYQQVYDELHADLPGALLR